MKETQQAKRLREIMRLLIRQLGLLEKDEAFCSNITITQCHAIVEIGRAGTLTLADLAGILSLDKSTVSRSADALVNQGILIRETDEADRRFITLHLTGQGQEMYREIEERMENYFQKVIHELPDDKKEQVIESIHHLVKAIRRLDCC